MVTCDRSQIKPRSKWRKENLQSGEMKERLLSFFSPSFSQSKLEVRDGDKEAAALVAACACPVGGRGRVNGCQRSSEEGYESKGVKEETRRSQDIGW